MFLSGFIALLPAAQVFADVIELNPFKDNTLIEIDGGTLSNGKGGGIFCGRTIQPPGFALRRAVLAFDIAGNIPAGSTITSVELRLRLTDTLIGDRLCSLHRLVTDWGEGESDAGSGGGGVGADSEPGDATWEHTFYEDMFWKNHGGDFDETVSGSTLVGVDSFHFWGPTEGMSADVQFWLDNPDANFGWILIGEEGFLVSAKRFGSREALAEIQWPLLTIEFTPPVSCAADLDGSGNVEEADLASLLGAWGPNPESPADFDDDDVVGAADLAQLLGSWGPCS